MAAYIASMTGVADPVREQLVVPRAAAAQTPSAAVLAMLDEALVPAMPGVGKIVRDGSYLGVIASGRQSPPGGTACRS